MYCPKCGTQAMEQARFCNRCGAPIPGTENYPKQKTMPKAINKNIVILLLGVVIVGAVFVLARPLLSRMNWFGGKAKFETKGGSMDTQIIFEADGKYMKVDSKDCLIKCEIVDTYKEDGDIIYELEPVDKEAEGQGVPIVSVAVRIPLRAQVGEVEGKWGYALLADLGEDGYFASGRTFWLERDGAFLDTRLLGGGEIIDKDGMVETAADLLFDKYIEENEDNTTVSTPGYWEDDSASTYRLNYRSEDREDYIKFTLKP